MSLTRSWARYLGLKRVSIVALGTLLLLIGTTVVIGRGEVTQFTPAPGTRPDDDARLDALEGWADKFGAEVQVELVDNWNWTGDAMARLNALEARVAALEGRATPASPDVPASSGGTQEQTQPTQGQPGQGETTEPQSTPTTGPAVTEPSPTPTAVLSPVAPPPATPVPTPTLEPLENRLASAWAVNQRSEAHHSTLYLKIGLRNEHNFPVTIDWQCSGRWFVYRATESGDNRFDYHNGPTLSGETEVRAKSRDGSPGTPRRGNPNALVAERKDEYGTNPMITDYSCRMTGLERA